MSAQQIYVKSPKGIDEMNNRSFGLPPRVRQVLILLDGKRSCGEVAEMLPDSDCDALLATLVEGDFIVPLKPAVAATAKGDSFEAPKDDAQRFEMAKNFMRNTINTFLGSMGSGLINQVNKCNNLDELRQHYQPWREAIGLSGDGRKQLDDLGGRLAALLS